MWLKCGLPPATSRRALHTCSCRTLAWEAQAVVCTCPPGLHYRHGDLLEKAKGRVFLTQKDTRGGAPVTATSLSRGWGSWGRCGDGGRGYGPSSPSLGLVYSDSSAPGGSDLGSLQGWGGAGGALWLPDSVQPLGPQPGSWVSPRLPSRWPLWGAAGVGPHSQSIRPGQWGRRGRLDSRD